MRGHGSRTGGAGAPSFGGGGRRPFVRPIVQHAVYWNRIHDPTFQNMVIRNDTQDANLSIFIYLVVLALPFAIFAATLHSLLQPQLVANPGLAAYKGPGRPVVRLSVVEDRSIAMASAAEQAATEANVELRMIASANEANKTEFVHETKKPRRIARRPAPGPAYSVTLRERDNGPVWNWKPPRHSYASYARWF